MNGSVYASARTRWRDRNDSKIDQPFAGIDRDGQIEIADEFSERESDMVIGRFGRGHCESEAKLITARGDVIHLKGSVRLYFEIVSRDGIVPAGVPSKPSFIGPIDANWGRRLR